MPTQPIRATPGDGNWRRDSSGMLVPAGGGLSAKELMQLPKEMRDLTQAANTLIRGKFNKELWPRLALLNAIAPRHRLTQIFIASVTAGSMAEDGQATANVLQALVQMLVPSAISSYSGDSGRRKDGHRFRKHHDEKVAEDYE